MKNIRVFSSENFHFLVVKFSVYLNRCVFVMVRKHNPDMCPTVTHISLSITTGGSLFIVCMKKLCVMGIKLIKFNVFMLFGEIKVLLFFFFFFRIKVRSLLRLYR